MKSIFVLRFFQWMPIAVFGLLTFCQMTWQHFDSPDMYYKALAILILGNYYDRFYFQAKGTARYYVYSFIVGLCLWNLIEELFFDPEQYDPSEYWGFVAGALFLTYQLWKKSKS